MFPHLKNETNLKMYQDGAENKTHQLKLYEGSKKNEKNYRSIGKRDMPHEKNQARWDKKEDSKGKPQRETPNQKWQTLIQRSYDSKRFHGN